MDVPGAQPDRLTAVLAAIDAANADDPHTIVIDGVERPKEQAHAELMTRWVRTLSPDCSDAQLIARSSNGGRVVTPPTDVPGQGRFAAVLDSEGNEIGLWQNVAG